ncbi:hypothetical protein [Ligilactobacillus salitolerans]|uniref:hypothetical protein n=1 Tax=Ligilactobacillus salitolerans TaxID=1808352 RepID=UPI001E4923ED|nr:hypothetical protein [Ligilactobacillus salitolerans]
METKIKLQSLLKKDWDSIAETLYLENTGTLAKVRENDKSSFSNLEEIDWDNL